MKRVIAAASLVAIAFPGLARAENVLTYHNSNTRHGAYFAPSFTDASASGVHLDHNFHASVSGNVYAQPLYWHPKGAPAGHVIVATENDQVSSLNGTTGATEWSVQLASPVPSSALPCGDINPEGITGTPVIDETSATLYLDSLTRVDGAPRHRIYALDLRNGHTLKGWPIDVDSEIVKTGANFSSDTQGERSAAMIFNKHVFFAYGGRNGDCGTYYGTVIQIDPALRKLVASWQTRAKGGGIWSQGGISSDGHGLFVTTGNTFDASDWQDGEAILRLRPGLAHSTNTADYYTPANWASLDSSDLDLGGTEAIPLNVPDPGGPAVPRVIAFGKDGDGYLDDRTNLGGIGGLAAIEKFSNTVIITAPAVYNPPGAAMVAFTNFSGGNCGGQNITMLNVAPSGPTPMTVAWCASFSGMGSPIITTSDGVANPIVWVVGAQGDGQLHGFNALTGAVLSNGGGATMTGLHRYQTLIEADGRLYVGANGTVYAFRP